MNDIDGKTVELCGVIRRSTTGAILFSDGIMEDGCRAGRSSKSGTQPGASQQS